MLNAHQIAALSALVREVDPQVVVEVGAAAPDLAALLAAVAPRAAVYSPHPAVLPPVRPAGAGAMAGPTGEVAAALDGSPSLVWLSSGAGPVLTFAYAAALQPGSALVVVPFHAGSWPDFARVGCVRDEAAGSALGGLVLRRPAASQVAPARAPVPLERLRRHRPKRPLRSVFLGDLRYCSGYRMGVAQAMPLLGAWHRDVSLRGELVEIDRQVNEMRPDLIWTHMLLWPPPGSPPLYDLLAAAETWRRRGAVVLLHDGDPRSRTRFAHDVSLAVDLALVNHRLPRAEWTVPVAYWPYAAMVQSAMAEPVPELRADFVFAGTLRDDGPAGLYSARTQCVRELQVRVGLRVYPGEDGVNNRLQVADVSASCIAAVGFGRPEIPGWVDTRVFQVPGSGGVLVHDDAGGVLEPGVHFVAARRYDVDSVASALERLRGDEALRERVRRSGFEHVQAHHTWRHRCAEVLEIIYGRPAS